MSPVGTDDTCSGNLEGRRLATTTHIVPALPRPIFHRSKGIKAGKIDTSLGGRSAVAASWGIGGETWFHPVWYTKYQQYSHLVQNLRYHRSCIYSYIQKCYAGTIFEFPENNGVSQKSSLPCLDLLSYLLSDFGIFSRQRKFHVTPVF